MILLELDKKTESSVSSYIIGLCKGRLIYKGQWIQAGPRLCLKSPVFS
jgi:hypothetical protein